MVNARGFEVNWAGELDATPEQVWDAITNRAVGWYWKISYEPRLGGAELGLSDSGGIVTAWEPYRHFATRAESEIGPNELDYVLEPRGSGTYLTYVHRGVVVENYETEVDGCRQHTDFYYHSLGEYLRHFAGKDAVYVSAHAPEASLQHGFARLRTALGVPDGAATGDRVRLTPAGLDPVDGVVDYSTAAFLGVRSADGLYRFYGRDMWGWPVGLAHHLFGSGVDAAATEAAWGSWLDGVFAVEAVA